ncbi:MAG TPA: hypothetical protein VKY85_20165 [Candidatus Angelobacter sp.]|nr:hypothetical protein [Candidatus Angelobacter sp.]
MTAVAELDNEKAAAKAAKKRQDTAGGGGATRVWAAPAVFFGGE